ncbi:hypothetical protein SK128_008315 [Halocaridina rubra]|uniref:Uncharacterized protein n=1 Tax=Halocaridina rubra TaxID=373956 RepID=A0AAN9AE47_HALRR
MKVEEKKRAFKEWLQCNSREKYERHREKNVETKQKGEEKLSLANVSELSVQGIYFVTSVLYLCLSLTAYNRLELVPISFPHHILTNASLIVEKATCLLHPRTMTLLALEENVA